MRKIYTEYFCIPQNGKITEKVMLTRVATTIAIIFVCLIAMSLSAYAYFAHNVVSTSTVIKSANFEASALITITENGSSTDVAITKNGDASYTAELKAGKIYTVTLDDTPNSTADTGFCIVTAVGCAQTYHTQQIGADESAVGGHTDKVIFDLKVTADTTVTIRSHWGTSSYYDAYKDTNNGALYITSANVGDSKLVMIINNVSEAQCDAMIEAESQNGSTPDNTTPDDTTPDDTTPDDTEPPSDENSTTNPADPDADEGTAQDGTTPDDEN